MAFAPRSKRDIAGVFSAQNTRIMKSIEQILNSMEDQIRLIELETEGNAWDGLSYAERYGCDEIVPDSERLEFVDQHKMTFDEGVQFRQRRRQDRLDRLEDYILEQKHLNGEETI